MSDPDEAVAGDPAPVTLSSLAVAREQHRPVQVTVRIPMRADLIDEIGLLELQIVREKRVDDRENREPIAPGLAARVQQLEDELAASEVAFTFRALGRRAQAKLIADHPPTAEQKAEAETGGYVQQYDPETFNPAALAASCISPAGTVEDWADICDTWSDGQFAQLWQAYLKVTAGSVDVGPKSLIASGILDESEKSSTTARR